MVFLYCSVRPLLPVAEKGQVSSHQRAADMFSGLENHSVLYVLHQSTRLASLEQQEVLNLLHKSPLQNNPGLFYQQLIPHFSLHRSISLSLSLTEDNTIKF